MKSMKFLIISGLIILVVILGLVYLQKSNVKVIEETKMVSIEEKQCQSNNDCELVYIGCGDCGVPIAVNNNFYQKYINEKIENCQNYNGPYCLPAFPYDTNCIEGQCRVIVEQE